MLRPGIVPGPPAWEASTLEKIQLESLFAIYSEPLLELRLALQQQQPGLYTLNSQEHGAVFPKQLTDKVEVSFVYVSFIRFQHVTLQFLLEICCSLC